MRSDHAGPPASEPPAVRRCLNCGATLVGPFCARCGQEDRDPEPPAWALLREMFADAVGADSVTWRSFKLLLTRPGALTVEYLRGRRRRYLPPLRLYLTATVPFLVLAVSTPLGRGLLRVQPSAALADRAMEFRETFFHVWPWVLVCLLPVFAAVYALLLVGVHATFTRHLVFTLHLHAFWFLTLAVAHVMAFVRPGWLAGGLVGLAMLASVVYLPLAVRRAYRVSWPASLGVLAGVLFLNLLILTVSTYFALQIVNSLM